MKNRKLFILIFSSLALAYPTMIASEDKPKIEGQQVGRFTLHIVNKGEEHIIYRIDTVTGDVSVFDPYTKTEISDRDIDKISKNPAAIKGLKDKGHLILENSFWKKLPEKLESIEIKFNEKSK